MFALGFQHGCCMVAFTPCLLAQKHLNFKFRRSYTHFYYLRFGEISFVTSYPQRFLVAWCALLFGFIRFTTANFSARKRWRPRRGPRAFSHWRLPCWVPCVFTGAKLTNQCFNRFRMRFNSLHWQTKPPRWYSLHGRGTTKNWSRGIYLMFRIHIGYVSKSRNRNVITNDLLIVFFVLSGHGLKPPTRLGYYITNIEHVGKGQPIPGWFTSFAYSCWLIPCHYSRSVAYWFTGWPTHP